MSRKKSLLLREKILLNKDWLYLPEDPEQRPFTGKSAIYLSAKTECVRRGPGAYHHQDGPSHWSLSEELLDEPWERVSLPHDYIISQKPEKKYAPALGFFRYHPAWYRRHFLLEKADSGKRIVLYFEGITGKAELYLNGCYLCSSRSSYLPFETDISDLARFGEDNVLAIRIDPETTENWWYSGGGMTRNVFLEKTDFLHVDRWGIYVPAEKISGKEWRITPELSVANDCYEEQTFSACCDLLDPEGKLILSFSMKGSIPAREKKIFRSEQRIASPKLWDLDSPELYTLSVTLSRNEKGKTLPCDSVSQKFGFRTIEMTAGNGVFLNGRPIKIKGVCAHSDYGLAGKAVPDNICRHKVRLMREMGANAFRTSHYAHQEATMDACDQYGLLVMDENRRFESNPETLAEMETLVLRDRNHPSVFLWSTSNEEMLYHGLEQGAKIQRALAHVIRKHDCMRPVTCAVTNLPEASVFKGPDVDVVGVNYSFFAIDRIHDVIPEKPWISTENCALGTTRGHYTGDDPVSGMPDARDREPAPGTFQCLSREKTWKFIMERPWLSGGFQWIAIEHRGEACWPRICSASGALDLFLQKKDAFYQNLSFWAEEPVIHLLPHWNWNGMEGLPIRVFAYTNCPEAELFLNGKSLGKCSVEPFGHAEWLVPFSPGRLEAVGRRKRKTVRDVRETTGNAVALKLIQENTDFSPNGMDAVLFTCLAVDENGREVPDASPLVTFRVSGCGVLLGTGSSNTDHVPVPSPVRKMYAGRISAAVRVNDLPAGEKGKILLTASADGLASAYNELSLFASKDKSLCVKHP